MGIRTVGESERFSKPVRKKGSLSPACECFLETEELVRGDEDDKA